MDQRLIRQAEWLSGYLNTDMVVRVADSNLIHPKGIDKKLIWLTSVAIWAGRNTDGSVAGDVDICRISYVTHPHILGGAGVLDYGGGLSVTTVPRPDRQRVLEEVALEIDEGSFREADRGRSVLAIRRNLGKVTPISPLDVWLLPAYHGLSRLIEREIFAHPSHHPILHRMRRRFEAFYGGIEEGVAKVISR